MRHSGRAIAGLAVAGAVLLMVFPPAALAPAAAKGAALALFGIGLWAPAVWPEHLTALAFFLMAMLFQVAPANVVFNGFYSTALWLVLSGLIIGAAVKRTGLGERLASRLGGAFVASYPGIIAGLMTVSVTLGFLMPSSLGRAVLLMPIAVALADRAGFVAGSNGRTGIVLAVAFGCHVPTFAILPANVPNMVLLGAAESLYKVVPTYGEYLLLHFPVLGLLKAAALVGLIVWLYPDRIRGNAAFVPAGKSMSREERLLTFVLVLALCFWATDFLHGISPAWIGLAAAVFLMVPGVGMVPAKTFSQEINFAPLFFVAGIMGLGGVVAHTGLGALLAAGLLNVLPLAPGEDAGNFAALTLTSTVVGLLTTLPGTPAVLTPLAGEMARASGWSVEAVLMTQVLGFSTILLPYQSAPLVVGMQLGGESIRPALKMALALAVLTIFGLFPLDYFWWRALGWIG